MVGPLPFDQCAAKAVGMPADPSSTSKPSARSRFTYHSAERYSRQAVSAKSQIVAHQADQFCRLASIHLCAVCVA